jgi:hypothetical protein
MVLVISRRHLGDLPGVVTPVLLDVLPQAWKEEYIGEYQAPTTGPSRP